MKAKMKVRVKYIYNSAALGGPEPMEISGTVFHIDDNGPAGGRLTLVKVNGSGTAYLHRDAIYEAEKI
jgi:hypothetical protein